MADEKIGPWEEAANAILHFLEQDAGVPNAGKIVLDGDLGTEFDVAKQHCIDNRVKTPFLTQAVRDAAKGLGINCRERGMTSYRWGEPYDRFVEEMKREAAAERAARERLH